MKDHDGNYIGSVLCHCAPCMKCGFLIEVDFGNVLCKTNNHHKGYECLCEKPTIFSWDKHDIADLLKKYQEIQN